MRRLEGWASRDVALRGSAFGLAPQDDGMRYNGGKFGGGTRRCEAAS